MVALVVGARARRAYVFALVLVLFAVAGAAAARAADYVALGDSYTAGPLIQGTPGLPLGCIRSSNNYPHLANGQLGLTLRDVSCSGAKTDHMTQPQGVSPGPNPPQFDALSANASVITLGIGGNDIGFSSIAQDCFSASPFGTPCKNKYVVGGVDTITQRIQAAAPKVAAVLQGIRQRAPSARVLVVNYPAILPDTGFGCWPLVPVTPGDVPYLRAKEKELNAMLASQAAANGATVVNWYAASVGHDACKSPTVKWVEGPVPTSPAAPVHPNLRGMQGVAPLVVAAAR
jgi:hypothetical protein